MKKTFAVSVFAFAVLLQMQAQECISYTMYVNSKTGLQVRSTPDINGERIGAVAFSGEVTVTKEDSNIVEIDGIEGKWVYIVAANIEGWVFSGYLVIDNPAIYGGAVDSTVDDF